MEWNSLLFWIAGLSSAIAIVRMVRSPLRQWGFIGVSALVLVTIGVAWLINPEVAGFAGGIVWAALVLAPAILYRRVTRASASMQYDTAARWAMAARLLHPLDGWWYLPRLYRANALLDRGEDAAAEREFEFLRTLKPPIGPTAEIQLHRLKRDWVGVAEVAQTASRLRGLTQSSALVPLYLRALGELNQIDSMLQVYEQCRLTFSSEAFSNVRAMARWMVLAYAGRTAALDELLDHFFRGLSRDRRRFWLARAEWAAGRTESAAAKMALLAQSPERGIAIAAAQILENPPPPAVFMPQGDWVLDQAEQDSRHERAYAIAPHGYANWPAVTYTIIAANIVVFFLEISMGGSENSDTLLKLGAAYPGGGWWRAITANFLHLGIAHILLNMLALRALGPFVEQFVGRVRFAIIYAISGVGAVAGVLVLMRMGLVEADYLVGASGAIMGLIGAMGAILLHGWLRAGAMVAKRRLPLIGFIVVLQVIFDAMTPQVSGSAHLIGLGLGFVVTIALISFGQTTPDEALIDPPRGIDVQKDTEQ